MLVSKSLPHECFNSSPWIFYNQFVTWCFLTHKVKFFSYLIHPQKSMGYTGAGLYLSQAAEMTVWFYSNQILQGLSQIHTSFFFLYLPWDLRSAILLFHLVLKVLCLTGPCHFTLHCPCRGLQALHGCTLFLQDQHQPCKTYSLTPYTLLKLTTAKLQEFLIFIIPMRTTFPVCKLADTSPAADPGPDDICPLSLLSSETLSSLNNRVCHSRQIFIY